MKKYAALLRRTKLFSGVGENDILSMLHCLNVQVRKYNKGEYAFRQGEYIRSLMILAGQTSHSERGLLGQPEYIE